MRRGVARPQRPVGRERIDGAVAVQLGGQADLVGLALADLVLAGGDVGQVRVAAVARGEAQGAGRGRRDRRRRCEAFELAFGFLQPGVGGGDAALVGERDQVDAALVVVEGDQPVAEDERGVGQLDRCTRSPPQSALSS